MATSDSVIGGFADSISVLHDIGLDSKGRSHHYDPAAHEIIVYCEDKRGRMARASDVVERIEPSPNSTGSWDYIQFVREEVDGLSWAETNAPEEAPDQ